MLCKSFSCWHFTQYLTPGIAFLRASGIGSPHSSQNLWLSPLGKAFLARATASSTVLSI
ncbi:hypothetical protein AB28_1207 [Raoultella ornithinolytica 2-156-04_S1_C2]|nr:hypothetical protein AB00_1194 [Raoultella ornithinolytica 2-156-04_S1_C1]KDX15110.1 hypothetical protein AB28_1207 [Raoultella ornithinolytica 2-156-04_S1_C2]